MNLDDFDLNPCPRCGMPVKMDLVEKYDAPWRMWCRNCGTTARGFTRDQCREIWNAWKCVQVLDEEVEA